MMEWATCTDINGIYQVRIVDELIPPILINPDSIFNFQRFTGYERRLLEVQRTAYEAYRVYAELSVTRIGLVVEKARDDYLLAREAVEKVRRQEGCEKQLCPHCLSPVYAFQLLSEPITRAPPGRTF